MILVMKWAVCATCPGSLMTAVQPAASAGASERIVSTTGEFPRRDDAGDPHRLAEDQRDAARFQGHVAAAFEERGGGVVAQLRRHHVQLERRLGLDLAILGRKQVKQRVAVVLEGLGELSEHMRVQLVIDRPARFAERTPGGIDGLLRCREASIGIFADHFIGCGIDRLPNIGCPDPCPVRALHYRRQQSSGPLH